MINNTNRNRTNGIKYKENKQKKPIFVIIASETGYFKRSKHFKKEYCDNYAKQTVKTVENRSIWGTH